MGDIWLLRLGAIGGVANVIWQTLSGEDKASRAGIAACRNHKG
jgi:hypothetical protein